VSTDTSGQSRRTNGRRTESNAICRRVGMGDALFGEVGQIVDSLEGTSALSADTAVPCTADGEKKSASEGTKANRTGRPLHHYQHAALTQVLVGVKLRLQGVCRTSFLQPGVAFFTSRNLRKGICWPLLQGGCDEG